MMTMGSLGNADPRLRPGQTWLRGARATGYNGPVAPASNDFKREVELAGEAATAALAAAVARQAVRGDVIALSGELGSGKTAFVRAFLRACGIVGEVPSPTFTLVQTYEAARGSIWHFDLYRLTRPEDALELGLEDALAEGITLIEWPERLGSLEPRHRLEIHLTQGPTADSRRARLTADSSWSKRLSGIADD
jgi:tRNA threonylcarbamoyl adenosine modification protein YjeE